VGGAFLVRTTGLLSLSLSPSVSLSLFFLILGGIQARGRWFASALFSHSRKPNPVRLVAGLVRFRVRVEERQREKGGFLLRDEARSSILEAFSLEAFLPLPRFEVQDLQFAFGELCSQNRKREERGMVRETWM
jgi:hypothetical protein